MAMDDADMAYKLSEFIDNYMDASEIFTTYWSLYRHSQARSGQKVRDILGLLEEDIRKFTEGARKYYFSKNAGKVFVSPFLSYYYPLLTKPSCKNSEISCSAFFGGISTNL